MIPKHEQYRYLYILRSHWWNIQITCWLYKYNAIKKVKRWKEQFLKQNTI